MFFNFLAEAGEEGNNPITLVLFGAIIVGMIALLVWNSISGKKKRKQAQDMVDSLKKGDRVKTIGGVCGFVYEINNDENTFVLETGADDKKSYVKFDKAAIYQTAPAEGAVVAEKATEAKVEEAPVEEVKKEEPVKEETAPKQVPKKRTAKKNTEEEAK